MSDLIAAARAKLLSQPAPDAQSGAPAQPALPPMDYVMADIDPPVAADPFADDIAEISFADGFSGRSKSATAMNPAPARVPSISEGPSDAVGRLWSSFAASDLADLSLGRASA